MAVWMSAKKRCRNRCFDTSQLCIALLQFDGACNLGGKSLHFGGFHLDVVVEVEVGLGLHGDEVDVGVGYFQSQHGYAYLDAGAHLFEAFGHAVCEVLEFAVEVLIEVEYVVNLFLGDAEHMPFHHWVDIKESETVVGFGNFVAGDLPSHDT